MQEHSWNTLLKAATLALAAGGGIASQAWASSPAAWTEHDREVASACAKASGLKKAEPVGRPMAYEDRVGFTVLLIQGRYPQPHMKNRLGRELCLFNRGTHDAAVLEADQLGRRGITPATSTVPAPK
jgi:hypothetical protein